MLAAGFDIDPACEYPYQANVRAPFRKKDVRDLDADELSAMWPKGAIRVLAGCAPCQPFSSYRRGTDTSQEAQWPLIDEVSRLVEGAMPEIVTMENVPRIGSTPIFQAFVATLGNSATGCGTSLLLPGLRSPPAATANGSRRLSPRRDPRTQGGVGVADYPTVEQAIGELPPLGMVRPTLLIVSTRAVA